MSSTELINPDDHRLAATLAGRAGEQLIQVRQELFSQNAPSAVLRAEGDRCSQDFLWHALAEARPNDAVLSEEATDNLVRLNAERVWVIDPLDGTREFSEPGRSDWAVHVALVIDERPVVGAVCLPALGLTLSTLHPPSLPTARLGGLGEHDGQGEHDGIAEHGGQGEHGGIAEHGGQGEHGGIAEHGGQGSWGEQDGSGGPDGSDGQSGSDGQGEQYGSGASGGLSEGGGQGGPKQAGSSKRLRLVVSRSRPPAQAHAVAKVLDAEMVSLGSAGAKAMAVVRGDADIYVHAGGQFEWDSCAPVAVAGAAGCATSRIDGTELRYNQPDPYLPDLVVCRPELHDAVLTAIAGAGV